MMRFDLAEKTFFDAHSVAATRFLPSDRAESPLAAEPSSSLDFTFIIPVKDEQSTLADLLHRIAETMGPDECYEVIFVDDGSGDDSWSEIVGLARRDPGHVRGLRFRRNAGKAAALTAGFRAARGRIVFTLDADLQDDPKEIRRFLAKLDEGYDLVSGWKKVRHDPWHKVLPSRVFNRMLSRVTGVRLHDHNCGFKCYRVEVVKSLTLHGELHRMVPALAAIEGFRAGEIVVEHHPRRHGVSKYGFERYLRGFVDMLTVGFLRKYRERPAHFIGGVCGACLAAAMTLLLLGAAASFAGGTAVGLALFVASTIFLGTSVLGAFCCLLAEIANRGGLGTNWSLPIVEDTAGPGSPMREQCPAATAVEPSFHAGF